MKEGRKEMFYNTYDSLCYTSRGALDGTRNMSNMKEHKTYTYFLAPAERVPVQRTTLPVEHRM